MSEEDLSEEDAGVPSKIACNIREHDNIIIKSRPCKVIKVSISKIGKLGAIQFVVIDLFNGKRLETSVPRYSNCDVPHINRTEYQLINIFQDGSVFLTKNGNPKNDLRLPTDEVGKLIREKFWGREHVKVTVMSAMGEEKICGVNADE